MSKRPRGASGYAMQGILLSLTLIAALAACSDSQPSCASNGTCYQPPQSFYGGSYYMNRGGFVYGGGGRSR